MNDVAEQPTGPPLLIVNADDYGQSGGINEGVARAHKEGIVTSASLMVRWPAAAEAARYALDHPDLSLGLHVDLGEWLYDQGHWPPLYTVVDPQNIREVQQELSRQVEAFRELVGRDPTHIDSHQHVHRSAALLPLFRALGTETRAFLRDGEQGIQYDGRFYGWDGHGEALPGSIEVGALVAIIRSLAVGTTELGCHPGLGDDMVSPYRTERSIETQTLCDPRVRAAIAERGVRLVSFHDLGRGEGSSP